MGQLQTGLTQRDSELRLREAQVRDKDEEMAELLKAVDTLRRKVSYNSVIIGSLQTGYF